jgi:hypothetical protein
MNTVTEIQAKKYPITFGKYLFVVIPLILVNTFILTITLMGPGSFDLNTAVTTSINCFTWIFFLICLVPALLIALIPYRGLTYRARYFPAVLFIFFIFQVLHFVVGVIPAIYWFEPEMLKTLIQALKPTSDLKVIAVFLIHYWITVAVS